MGGLKDTISPTRATLKKPRLWRGVHLFSSRYPVYLVLFYAILVLFSWVITSVITFRPIPISHYGISKWDGRLQEQYFTPEKLSEEERKRARYLFNVNQNWYKTAQVIQSIVSVLTIPLTSAVCSSAAVVYFQHSNVSKYPAFTLRQMSVLADKGWSDVWTLLGLATGRGNRYITSFLLWAIFLHAVGALISPLQQVFLSTETIKTQTFPQWEPAFLDIPDIIQGQSASLSDVVSPEDDIITGVRARLVASQVDDLRKPLWPGAENFDDSELNDLASMSSIYWPYLARLPGSFQAEVPTSFLTGLTKQFLPRFNISSSYEKISESDFPSNCDKIPGSFSAQYERSVVNSTGETISWAVHACMPFDIRKTPWKNTRARQDFSESLYLNISLSLYEQVYNTGSNDSANINIRDAIRPLTPEFYRVTVDTTTGYFELPNYMNGESPGPLLNDGPYGLCRDSESCLDQINFGSLPFLPEVERKKIHNRGNKTLIRGPLTLTTLALFGSGSWLDTIHRIPTMYDSSSGKVDSSTECIDIPPLGSILNTIGNWADDDISFGGYGFWARINRCVSMQESHEIPGYGTAIAGSKWLYNFLTDGPDGEISAMTNSTMAGVFTFSAYSSSPLALGAVNATLSVAFDLGSDSKKPSISLAGIILISILIAIDLFGLMATAIYASRHPRWTNTLNAFALMRIGGSISEHIPLKYTLDDDDVEVLDKLPGWVGNGVLDKSGNNENDLDEILLGGSKPLDPRGVYEAYDGASLRKRLGKNGINLNTTDS